MGAKIVCLNPTPKLTYPLSDKFDIQMTAYDISTTVGEIHVLTPINNAKDVVKKVSKIFLTNVKVALFYGTFNDENIEIMKALKEYYQKKEIPFFCCSSDSIYYSSILLAYVEEFGEHVIEDSQTLLIIFDDRMYSQEISARSIEIKRRDDYFYFDDIELIKEGSMDYTDEKFKNKYFTTSNVFVYFEGYCNAHQEKTFNLIAAKLKGFNIRRMSENKDFFQKKAIMSKALKYIGEKPFKYDFATLTFREFMLGAWESRDPDIYKKPLINVKMFEVIPAKKTIIFYQTFEKIVCATGNGMHYKGTEMPAVTEIGLAATFSIDSFLTPKVTVHKHEKVVSDTAIIKFDYNEFSIEIIQNGKLESIDLDKVPLMISFVDGIQVGKEAGKNKETHKSFVVQDLLTIADDSEYYGYVERANWGFQIELKDYCKYIIFDTFRGRRKATVPFLLAIIIRWAIAKAELKLGKMPETIVIVVNRLRGYLKHNLEIACENTKLKNIDIQLHQYKIVQIK